MQALLITALALFASQDSRVLTDRFEAPEGLVVSLWAESPQLYNPTGIDVDPRGRVWVIEDADYRSWNGANKGKAVAATEPKGLRRASLGGSDVHIDCDSYSVACLSNEVLRSGPIATKCTLCLTLLLDPLSLTFFPYKTSFSIPTKRRIIIRYREASFVNRSPRIVNLGLICRKQDSYRPLGGRPLQIY